MFNLLVFSCALVISATRGSNFTIEIRTDFKTEFCRNERRIPLSMKDFTADTCARCYLYMPTFSFRNKLQYMGISSLLLDLQTNISHPATPVNTSQAVIDSFTELSYILKWKECCLAAASCCDRMLRTPSLKTDGPSCTRTWDGWQCWDDTPGGTTAINLCPGHIYFENDPPSCPKYAYKECWPNGTWFGKEYSREWTNYTKCGRMDEHRNSLYFHIATYSVSIVALVPALIIFSIYKQLQVHRISMHKNLFFSLFLNGVVVVLFKSIVIVDELKRTSTYETIMEKNGDACKMLFILTKYFRMTNYMWMFCEGFYLHKLIAAAFAEQKNLIMFYIIGWVFPILPVGIYAILRKTMDDEKCWAFPAEIYEWIMNAPNLASLLVNLIFLCNIIRVLVTKLRATHSNEPNQYRKAVKATLVLVPLFGLQFGLVIYRPPPSTMCGMMRIYTYFSHALDGLQGFLVSLIFCYMNGEVLYLLKRSYQRFYLRHSLKGRNQSGMMMNQISMTQVSSMTDTQASQHGLHYRTKIGDKSRNCPETLSRGNSMNEDVACV